MNLNAQSGVTSDNGGYQVLCKTPERDYWLIFHPFVCLLAFLLFPIPKNVVWCPGDLLLADTHALLPEASLAPGAKSPLRLITERRLISKGVWRERLVCGHSVLFFQEFLWDEKGHLVLLEPTAKRRRCQKCRDLALLLSKLLPSPSPKKPVHSVRLPQKERAA